MSISGLPFIAFIVLLALKLAGVIAFGWLWVTAPLWISAGLFVVGAGTAYLSYKGGKRLLTRHFR